MDPILHSVIALGCMGGCYYAGHFFATRNMFEPIILKMLEKLEAEGFIYTKLDKDGDKELIPVSEIVAKTLRDAIKSTK